MRSGTRATSEEILRGGVMLKLLPVVLLAVLLGFGIGTQLVLYRGMVPVKQAVADEPPELLNINGERWHVVGDSFGPDFYEGKLVGYSGFTDCARRIVWYATTDRPQIYSRENLWHEIGHALRCS